jgi:hypothetical protein
MPERGSFAPAWALDRGYSVGDRDRARHVPCRANAAALVCNKRAELVSTKQALEKARAEREALESDLGEATAASKSAQVRLVDTQVQLKKTLDELKGAIA